MTAGSELLDEPRYFNCPNCDMLVVPCAACGAYPRRCEHCGKSLRQVVRQVERDLREWREERERERSASRRRRELRAL